MRRLGRMQELVKAKSDADFLAMVPHLLGFRPRESVVLIGFRGKRTHGALRLDQPTAAVGFSKFAAYALGTMGKIPGLEGIAVVVLTDSPVGSTAAHEFAKLLIARVERSNFSLRGAWCIGTDGWVSYSDEYREVRSLYEIELSDVAISRAELAPSTVGALPEVSGEVKQRVTAHLERLRDPAAVAEYDLTPDHMAGFLELALEWQEAEFVRGGGFLLDLFQMPIARDAAMLQWASTQQIGELLWGFNYDAEGADLMMGRGPRPELDRVEKAIALVGRLVAVADDADRVAPLCMLGWLHWALGRGSAGGGYLDMALALDPDYGLANLLATMMSNGILPEWAFTVDASIADA